MGIFCRETEKDMYKILSLSVGTSIGLKESLYYFRFKGVAIKYYVSQKNHEPDCISILYPIQQYSADSAYKLLTEFLSLWAFTTDEIVVPGLSMESGTVFRDELSALKANITVSDLTIVSKTTISPTIIYLPKIENDIQDSTVRLYRIARSQNDVYSQILFFWHTIIYPSAEEKDAEQYIQNFVNKNIPEYKHVHDEIDQLLTSNPYGKQIKKNSFGQHIREDIRHAIAHIVRKYNSGSIEIDNRLQQNYIAGVSRVLRHISRYKIQNEHGLSLCKPHGINYFCQLSAKELE